MKKIMAQMMGKFKSEMTNLLQASTSGKTSEVGLVAGSREASQSLDISNREKVGWNDEYEDEQSDMLEIHAESEFEEGETQSDQGEKVSTQFAFPVSQQKGTRDVLDNLSGGSPSTHSHTSMLSRDQEKELQWASVLHQLPSYYDNLGTDLTEETPAHKSYLADAFQGRRSKSLPRLPLDGMLKNKWESIEKYMSVGEVSPCMSSTSKKFLIKEADFEKYSRVPQIDQEYTAMTCVSSKPYTQSRQGSRKASKTDPSIKDKNLRIAECDLQKCDESARVMLRAASHGSLILNAANTVLSNKEKFSPDEAVNLIHGAFQCMDAITDCAMRTTARSISARRRIYLSQIHFKDPNAQKDLMRLPMDGKYLFHGEFSQAMHKYATMARDAKETSDYVSSRSTPLKRTADNPPKGSTFKKPATFRQDNNSSSGSGLLVNKQGNQERQVSFKRDNKSNFPNKKPLFQKKGRGGEKQ